MVMRKLLISVLLLSATAAQAASTSEANRKKQHLSLTAEILGSQGEGGALGLFLGDNVVLEASHVGLDLELSYFEFKTSLSEIRAKTFLGNSFYVNAGAGYQLFEGSVHFDFDETYSSSTRITRAGAVFAIGNQWQWEYFTLGCDWIGAFIPFGKAKVDIDYSHDISEEDKKAREKDLEGIMTLRQSLALRFYLGLTF